MTPPFPIPPFSPEPQTRRTSCCCCCCCSCCSCFCSASSSSPATWVRVVRAREGYAPVTKGCSAADSWRSSGQPLYYPPPRQTGWQDARCSCSTRLPDPVADNPGGQKQHLASTRAKELLSAVKRGCRYADERLPSSRHAKTQPCGPPKLAKPSAMHKTVFPIDDTGRPGQQMAHATLHAQRRTPGRVAECDVDVHIAVQRPCRLFKPRCGTDSPCVPARD